ncbi:hypothetical protein [Virgibacillus siamensis]|uniref:hypothetical protein n=1 Tax=Virgibacillus siamensis TaxID=480071 RepID=UPI001FEBCADD|nr:hypothetical protein [Virgibacillus siamensis]
MKKMMIILLALMMFGIATDNVRASSVECPNPGDLEQTSVKNEKELRKALEKIIPKVYAQGDDADMYSEWKIITATPFPKTVGDKQNEVYYEMAINFCGTDVAAKSWLVRIHFPKLEGKSASNAEGQIFLAKSKEKGWFVWFRYH